LLHLGVAVWLLLFSVYRGIRPKFIIYQGSMYYIILCNLYYEYIENFTNRDLWEFSKPFVNLAVTEFFYMFITLPCLTFLFLNNHPEAGKGKILYHYAKWIVISFSLSYIGYKTGYIYYTNGYSLKTEFLFYCIMYPMLRLHFKKPKPALILSLCITLMFLIVFRYKII